MFGGVGEGEIENVVTSYLPHTTLTCRRILRRVMLWPERKIKLMKLNTFLQNY